MDTAPPGLLLWTQRCGGGIAQGKYENWQNWQHCPKLLLLHIPLICLWWLCVQAGADVNLPNNMGDTPLHKAAFTGRKVQYCVVLLIIFLFSILSFLYTVNLVHYLIICFHYKQFLTNIFKPTANLFTSAGCFLFPLQRECSVHYIIGSTVPCELICFGLHLPSALLWCSVYWMHSGCMVNSHFNKPAN